MCPTCSTPTIERFPKRNEEPMGRVTMTCKGCGRVASYLARTTMSTPEDPRTR